MDYPQFFIWLLITLPFVVAVLETVFAIRVFRGRKFRRALLFLDFLGFALAVFGIPFAGTKKFFPCFRKKKLPSISSFSTNTTGSPVLFLRSQKTDSRRQTKKMRPYWRILCSGRGTCSS